MSVSVVIPAHNAGRFIDECVQSVLAQERPADEILIINDGSTDRDYDGLSRLAPNIRVVNQTNRGVSATRNRGCDMVRGEYVAILDADDAWLPWKLGAQMQHLERHPQTDAVFCRGMYWRPGPSGTVWTRPPRSMRPGGEIAAKRLHYRDFLQGIPVASSSMVVRRQVWQAIGGFNENMRYAEDQHFNLRLAHGYRVDVLQMIGTLYRQHATSATAHIQEPNHWAEVILGTVKTLGLVDAAGVRVETDKLRRWLAQLHMCHGYDHFWRGQLPIARREFWRAFRKDPLSVKALGYLAVLLLPGLPQLAKKSRPSLQHWLAKTRGPKGWRIEGTLEPTHDVRR
jgi:glycosyltransferase involved in cell wall biosynthesis